MWLDVDERDSHILLLSCTIKLPCCNGESGYFYINNNFVNPENVIQGSSCMQWTYCINSSLLRIPSLQCACIGSSGSHVVSNIIEFPPAAATTSECNLCIMLATGYFFLLISYIMPFTSRTALVHIAISYYYYTF